MRRFLPIVLTLVETGSFTWAAVDMPCSEKLEGLLSRMAARGWPEETLAGIFADDRITLYPEIVGRKGKGLNYRGRQFGLFTKKSVRGGRNMLQANRTPLSIKRPWTGAFGLPQLLPSSYRKNEADGNRDGTVDLQNRADSFAGIANYLKPFGWSRPDPVKNKEAVHAYNHCDNHVQAVLAYARALKK